MSHRPIILGIVGDSAAGKTTLTKGIAQVLGPENVTAICTDDYHRYDRTHRAEMGISALHPDCNYLDIMEQHLGLLQSGQPILKPIYNHSTGKFDPPEYLRPNNFVIAEGLLGYYSRGMRDLYDVKVYLAPPEPLRQAWKIKRDTQKRGYNQEQVLAELNKREPDSEQFIRPQRQWADLVVSFYPPSDLLSEGNGHLNVRLILRPTIPHPELVEAINQTSAALRSAVRLELERDMSKPVDVLEVDGHATKEQVSELEDILCRDVSQLRRFSLQETEDNPDVGRVAGRERVSQSYPLAITQLLIAYHMLKAAGAN